MIERSLSANDQLFVVDPHLYRLTFSQCPGHDHTCHGGLDVLLDEALQGAGGQVARVEGGEARVHNISSLRRRRHPHR